MSRPAHALAPGRGERIVRGGVLVYVTLLVSIPLLTLVVSGFSDGIGVFLERITLPVARDAIWLTLWTALLVAVINMVLGTATAWVLVRYNPPGRAFISALVDLPLAIPTLVAGIMIAILFGPTSMLGQRFSAMGIEIVFAKPSIVLALLFVTVPFVIRAIEPLLEEIDPAEEEAAIVLGAGPFKTFRTVFFPAILPAAISGGIRSLGRAVGEFGSIVVVAGNIPFETLTAPIYVFGEIESGEPHAAAAVSVVLLAFALGLHGLARFLENRTGARNATR